MSTRLRHDVELVQSDDGLQLLDHLTGAAFELEPEYRFLLQPEVSASDNEEHWLRLRALAVVEEQLSTDEIVLRQRQARVSLTRESQLHRFRELLRFCVTNVPYYRARRDAYPLDKPTRLEQLGQLPFVRKTDVRESMPSGMLAEGFDLAGALARKTAELSATSGTTGERLQVVVDLELDAVPANYADIWNIEDTDATPRTAVLTGPLCVATECHLGKLPMEQRIRADYTLVLNSADDLFSVKRDLIENIAEEMHRFRPELLLVNPFYLHWVARQAARHGISLPPVKLILSSYQYLSGLQRRELTKLMGAPVLNYYAATDLAGSKIGLECHRGRLHVREDQSFVEVVGPHGACAPGERGALAVTSLSSRLMPLVRYLVGDIGQSLDAPCDCAIQDWPVLELHGRAKDQIWVDGRWLSTRDVDQAVSQLPDVAFYKCIQADEELRFEMILAHDTKADPRALETQLADLLRAPRVRTRTATRLDPEPSLKFRLTQSLTHPPPDLP